MRFNYQARTKDGQVQTGVVEAASKQAALNLLQKYDLYITLLEPASILPIYAKKIKLFERTSRKEIVLFSRQLAIMFKAQVPMIEALNTLANQIKDNDFKEKILGLSEDVEGGASFSKALSRYPKAFSPFFVSVIKSGEASGKLSEVLQYLADHLEREYRLDAKLKGAMIYPCLILFVVSIVLAMMIFFVIPNLAKVLTSAGQDLPAITEFIINLSVFLRSWGWLLALAFFGLIFTFFRYRQKPEGRQFFDELFLRIPMLSDLLKMVYLSRFAENLSTLISGGIPIARSLDITAEIVGNQVYKEVILKARKAVQKGESINFVLKNFPDIFSPLFIQMTIIGEKTGTLGSALMEIVNFYQQEVDRKIENLLSILEPGLIVILGLIVAGLMVSVLLPLYQVISL